MELTITVSDTRGTPTYPYRKVMFMLVAGLAEVADLPCEGPASENIVFHEDLYARLLQRSPEFDTGEWFLPGWITQSGDEAALSVVAHVGSEEAQRFGEALREWCVEAGVRRLVVSSTISRNVETDEESSTGVWGLPT